MAQSRPYQRLYRALSPDEALATSILRVIDRDGYLLLPKANNGPSLVVRRAVAKMMSQEGWFTIDHLGAVRSTETGKAWLALLTTENHPITRGKAPKRSDY